MIGIFARIIFAIIIPRTTRTALFACIVLYILATTVTIIGTDAIAAIVGDVGVVFIPIVIVIVLVLIIFVLVSIVVVPVLKVGTDKVFVSSYVAVNPGEIQLNV